MMTKKVLILCLLVASVITSVNAQRLRDAQEAMELEQYDKARTILQALIDRRPKVAENYFYLGQIHLINDKVDSAEYVFKQGVEANAKEKLNTVGLGAVDLQKGNEAAAESKFAQATSGLGRREYLPLYFAGRAYLDAPTPDYTKAIEYLTQAKVKNAKDPLIPTAMGDAYTGLREVNQAWISYRDALMIDENLLAPQIGQAVLARWSQAYDEVINNLSTLINEHPNHAPLFRELAETYYYSSLRLADDQEDEYRELNQKALEAYRRYLSLSGDQSVEAKIRYADFLVYTQNYEELKNVAQELTAVAGADAKIYRYLGYIAFLQDKEYDKAKENLNTLFSQVDENRLIAQDYLIAGLSELASSNPDTEKGQQLLKDAVAKQGEDDSDMDATIAETAFAKYQDGEFEVAKRIFAVAAANPESDYYHDSNFYLGTLAYTEGSRLYLGDGQEPEDLGAERLEAARPDLESAVKSLDIVAKSTKEDVIEKYQVDAQYYKALSLLALDNMQYNLEEAQGVFVPAFEELMNTLKAKEELNERETGYLVDANNYLGYFAYIKGENAKAKGHFEEILRLDPTHENAQFFVENL